jgi:hypothetical protein
MSDAAARQRQLVIDRALNGKGTTSRSLRRAAFDNDGVVEPARALVDKVARRAWTVTSADVAAVTAAGMADDEVFELVVCAALGQSTRQLEAALAALDQAAPGERGDEEGGE